MDKKKWVRPILTIITRGEHRQDSVLSYCKNRYRPVLFGGPVVGQVDCMFWTGDIYVCMTCREAHWS